MQSLRNPPPSDKGKAVRIFYASQVAARPPLFVVWSNYPEMIHFSYKRYLENSLREAFEFAKHSHNRGVQIERLVGEGEA